MSPPLPGAAASAVPPVARPAVRRRWLAGSAVALTTGLLGALLVTPASAAVRCPTPTSTKPAAPVTTTASPTAAVPTTTASPTVSPTAAASPTAATPTATVAPSAPADPTGSPTQSPATQSPPTQSPPTQSPATQSPATQSPATQSPATQSPATQSPTRAPTAAPRPQPCAQDGALERALATYARSRPSSVSVGVYDAVAGQWHVYRPVGRYDNASIVKVNILEAVLYRAQLQHRWLTGWEQDRIASMIRHSDNDACDDLWGLIGGGRGLARYDALAGLRSTVPGTGPYWGLTVSDVTDQVTLWRHLTEPRGLLSDRSRAYALSETGKVEAPQRWGVGSGVPAGTSVSLKNGWLPRPTHGWRVNSVGRVRGNGRDYSIAVLSTDNPSYEAGVRTVSDISGIVWRALAPAPAR